MKRVLKRSQIIEKLHLLLHEKMISISLFTELQFNDFYRVYVLVVHYKCTFQVISITLQFGWIQVEFCNCYSILNDAISAYKRQIECEVLVSDQYDELNK